jgi:hypothetical protein
MLTSQHASLAPPPFWRLATGYRQLFFKEFSRPHSRPFLFTPVVTPVTDYCVPLSRC